MNPFFVGFREIAPTVYRLIDAALIANFFDYPFFMLESKFWPYVHYCARY